MLIVTCYLHGTRCGPFHSQILLLTGQTGRTWSRGEKERIFHWITGVGNLTCHFGMHTTCKTIWWLLNFPSDKDNCCYFSSHGYRLSSRWVKRIQMNVKGRKKNSQSLSSKEDLLQCLLFELLCVHLFVHCYFEKSKRNSQCLFLPLFFPLSLSASCTNTIWWMKSLQQLVSFYLWSNWSLQANKCLYLCWVSDKKLSVPLLFQSNITENNFVAGRRRRRRGGKWWRVIAI